jgi:hypothetical protein
MRWCPYILTPILTEDEWDVILKSNVTEAEWAEIIEQRRRSEERRNKKRK